MDLESLPPDSDQADPVPELEADTAPARRRRPFVVAGVGAALALAVGGYAVGSALNASPGPTVQLANTAAATSNPSTSTGPTGPFAGRFSGHRRGAAGKVTSIGTNSFVLSTPRGSITIQTDGSTTYATEATGQVSDAKVGTQVLVHGTSSTTTTIAAQQLVLLPTRATPPVPLGPRATPPPPANAPALQPIHRGIAVGTVASNDATTGTLTITTRANTTVTVTTDAKTTVLKTVTASFNDVKVGDVISAVGPAPSTAAPANGATAPAAPAAPTTLKASHIDIVPAALAGSSLRAGGFANFPLFPFGGRRGTHFGPGRGPGGAPGQPGSTPRVSGSGPMPLAAGSSTA